MVDEHKITVAMQLALNGIVPSEQWYHDPEM